MTGKAGRHGTMLENAGIEGKDLHRKRGKIKKYHRNLEVIIGHTLQYGCGYLGENVTG